MAVSNSLFVHFLLNESYTDMGNFFKQQGRRESANRVFLEELYFTMKNV
jgi:hypothetical protein